MFSDNYFSSFAFKIPFELFLFSYAVLGPLHYLTEINWLKEKKYFVKNTSWIVVLGILTCIVSLPMLGKLSVFQSITSFFTTSIKPLLPSTSQSFGVLSLLTALIFAIGLIHFKKRIHLLLFFFASWVLSVIILQYIPFSFVIVGVFLPTLIHVYLFTLLFMIFGYMQNKTLYGFLAIVLLVFTPIFIGLYPVNSSHYLLSTTVEKSFLDSGFIQLSQSISKIFTKNPINEYTLLSVIGIKIQIFIAFAYTYHYLNWFSKTTVIGWNKNLSPFKIMFVVLIWFASVGLYAYDYKTGLMVLFLLSFLHVLLEFPLNIVVIKSLFNKIFAKG